MSRIKKIIYKIRIIILHFLNNLQLLFTLKRNQKIYIVSSPKYQNKIKEDLTLQKYFLKNNCYCKIVTWQDDLSHANCLIRSVWGYCDDLTNFLNFISRNKPINAREIIYHNIDKKKQYNLLEKYDINHIKTKFYNSIQDFKVSSKKQVIKPLISESGQNTFLISEKDDLEKIKDLKNFMVQPYISGIEDGELSLIVLGKTLEYGVIRFPGVFSSFSKEIYVPLEKIPDEAISIFEKVKLIKEYDNALFMRIDLVKDKNTYKVLELELVDPDLFIESIPNKKLKTKVYNDLVNLTIKHINQ